MLLSMERILVAAAIVELNGRYLLARRCDGGTRDGFWEFPGGKIEPGETSEAALVREINEELRVSISTGVQVATVDWDYPDVSIRLIGISATIDNGMPDPLETIDPVDHDRVAWFTADEMRVLPLLPADRALLDRLLGERSAR